MKSIKRQLGLDPYEEQILAGLAMLDGNIVDMKTGEGKTLAALFTICTVALLGNGIQVLTFNDYLARRDAEWASPLFRELGLSYGFIQQNSSQQQRKQAYSADVCYLTAREFGFDYLRDGRCRKLLEKVQREFDFILIDEVDSILIDEARSPLVIASAEEEKLDSLIHLAKIIRSMKPDTHLLFDEHKRNVSFTDSGIGFLEKRLERGNLYDQSNSDLATRLLYAAQAEYLLKRDTDYILTDSQIRLVDEFTGRTAEFRRWPDGLHDAVEAKENLYSHKSASILDSISLQDLCKLVPNIAGMTGTAIESSDEFHRFYNLNVIVIPTHMKCKREDFDDRIFATARQKNAAIIEEISHAHSQGRPVLVGTSSITESSTLAALFKKENIPFQLLNAHNDYQEATIIKQAGCYGAVTISTNMAGRGTDIVLGGGDPGEKTRIEAIGGLYVIGTNRHESERIDYQLRGRAGRQGDKGSSRFFVSLDDPLFEKYGIRSLIEKRLPAINQMIDANGEINSIPLKKLINHLQKVIDGENLEIKKTLSKYSGFREKHRLHIRQMKGEFFRNTENSMEFFKVKCPSKFTEIGNLLSRQSVDLVCSDILVSCIDRAWTNHLADTLDLQSCISLRALGGRQPVLEFQIEANQWFLEHLQSIETKAIAVFNSIEIVDGHTNLTELGVLNPSSTWTYQINDEFFNDMRDALLCQPGFGSRIGVVWWPFAVTLFMGP